MSVSPVKTGDSSATTDAGIASNSNTAAELKDEFLTLMVAQIRNQDPLNPLDGTEYVSQLAQMSTVEGIQNMSQLQQQNNILMDTLQVLQTTQLVGKQVSLPVDRVRLESEEALQGQVKLSQPADNVTIRAIGTDGRVVEEVKLGSRSAGETKFELPALPAGSYRIEVVAQRGDTTTSHTPYLNRVVERVSVPGNGGDVLLQVSGVGNLSLFSISEFLGGRS